MTVNAYEFLAGCSHSTWTVARSLVNHGPQTALDLEQTTELDIRRIGGALSGLVRAGLVKRHDDGVAWFESTMGPNTVSYVFSVPF